MAIITSPIKWDKKRAERLAEEHALPNDNLTDEENLLIKVLITRGYDPYCKFCNKPYGLGIKCCAKWKLNWPLKWRKYKIIKQYIDLQEDEEPLWIED